MILGLLILAVLVAAFIYLGLVIEYKTRPAREAKARAAAEAAHQARIEAFADQYVIDRHIRLERMGLLHLEHPRTSKC